MSKEIGMAVEWLKKDFDIDEMIRAIRSAESSEDNYANEQTQIDVGDKKSASFQNVCDLIENYFATIHEKDKNPKEEKNRWAELQHGANIGMSECVTLFKSEIEKYIRSNQLVFDYPNHYKNAVDAIFDETFGFGCWNLWNSEEYRKVSQSSFIYGTDVYFDVRGDFVKQPFRYKSEERVIGLAHQLSRISNRAELSPSKPSLEINMFDSTRVAIFIPPLVNKPLIIFRNPIIKKTSFEVMVREGTIEDRSLEMHRLLARLKANSLIVGPIRTGKSTFLKAIFDARQSKELVVSIENGFPELYLNTHYPEQPVAEYIVNDYEMDTIFPKLLRVEHDYLIVAEMRYLEVELAIKSTERGKRGTIGTYHTQKVKDIPRQLTSLVTDRYQNRSYFAEFARIAESFEVIYTMKRFPNNKIRCIAVTEIRLEDNGLQVSAHDFCRFNEQKNKFEYKYDLSDELIQKFNDINRDETTLFLNKLKELENLSPITGDNVTRSVRLQA